MDKLIFDSGIKEYQLGDCGILRFNPADPNVYARFMDAVDNIQKIEDELVSKGNNMKQDGTEVLKLMADVDRRIKEELNHVFGMGNDFNEIMRGVNLMAVAGNGERVISNLLNALSPVMKDGAERCAADEVAKAKAKHDAK